MPKKEKKPNPGKAKGHAKQQQPKATPPGHVKQAERGHVPPGQAKKALDVEVDLPKYDERPSPDDNPLIQYLEKRKRSRNRVAIAMALAVLAAAILILFL
jgi:hypothetical protein